MQDKKHLLEITNRGYVYLKNLMSSAPKNACGIRVIVKSGGCSGYTYGFEYAVAIDKYDEVVDRDDIKVVVDAKAILRIMGSVLDYHKDKFKEGIVITNPNEKSKCGCGKSFSL